MRHLRLQTAILLAGAVFCALPAGAQTDIEKPLPNVMLLVDTSGSMEYKAEANPSTGDFDYPVCNPGDPSSPNESSRWIDLLSVMTGTFVNYSCFSEDRSTSAFRTEFALPDVPAPYDFGYDTPYHRPLSNNCLIGPGVVPDRQHPYEFPDKAVNTFTFIPPSTVLRPVDPSTHPGCSAWEQRPDGMLDIYRGRMRFGLMTFDSHPDPGTGVNGASGADNPSGENGAWSYYVANPGPSPYPAHVDGNSCSPTNPNYPHCDCAIQTDQPRTGRPPHCTTAMQQEVGGRNAAAPPWEGRMVAFGDNNADPADAERRAQWIEQILLSTRPYGATPLAAQLDDAMHFLWTDGTTDPITGTGAFGPKDDALWKADCRKTVMILLSDGEPNLDLRPFCEDCSAQGVCPYETPAVIADTLVKDPLPHTDGDSHSVETFVIGFAMKDAQPYGSSVTVPCAHLTDAQCSDPHNANDRSLQACCTLNQIALAGSTSTNQTNQTNNQTSNEIEQQISSHPRRAFFPRTRQELRSVFNGILGSLGNPTTRTAPAFSTVAGAGAAKGMQFSSGFDPAAGSIWQGKLTRQRTICDATQTPTQLGVSITDGDDFAAHVNSRSGSPRQFFGTQGVVVGTGTLTLRPNVDPSSNYFDGIDNRGANLVGPLSVAGMVDATTATRMNVSSADCTTPTLTDEQCADAIMTWALGDQNADGAPQRQSLLGGIYNSSPAIVSGPAEEFLRDENYRRFAAQLENQKRSTVLYTSTVDGFLHAFKVAPYDATGQKVDSLQNNELWSFIPPAVLSVLKTEYPSTPAVLLDGAPIIADVPASSLTTRTVLERTPTSAQAGDGTFRTILVQGFGEGQVEGGYFALDVTTPDLENGGPKFLWQLTRDNYSRPIFGSGGTPLITNLAVKVGSGSTATVVNTAVAILPGGNAGTPLNTVANPGPLGAISVPTYAQRPQVRRYSNAGEARSLTIVRLDTGEILRSFRTTESLASIDPGKVTVVDIPAPIVGQPAAYPTDTATNADRLFVGDREGRLWRIDVGNPDPAQWSMKVFFDAMWGQDFDRGQPVETQPVLTTDPEGNVVVAFSTGAQRVQSAPSNTINRVVSLTDKFGGTGNTFVANLNWQYNFGCPAGGNPTQCNAGEFEAERVTGRMGIFGGVLYFATGIPGTDQPIICAKPEFRLAGMDYISPRIIGDPLSGGLEKLPKSSTDPTLVQLRDPGTGVVFGSTIEHAPSCFTEQTVASDAYLGSGSHTLISSVNPGAFSLTFQVGAIANNTQTNTTGSAVIINS
ncbi:MAG TPA: hypothetical protein VL137_00925, partial [Polyangiaceae bacterium]|nr:hypothetical protein [Polyangiaceae bacterium]